MNIDLTLIGEDGREFAGEETVDILGLNEEGVRLNGVISCRFFAQIVSQRLILKGTWCIPLELECCRCGEFFSTTLSDSSFLRDYAVSDEMAAVDITEDIRESVLLELPNFPLCGEACRGRSLYCGQNLNRTDCGCSAPAKGGTWDALNGLDLK
jgi:uncharacterized metal-binding protein YceD (DUF177 family)